MHAEDEEDGKETVYGRHGWNYFRRGLLKVPAGQHRFTADPQGHQAHAAHTAEESQAHGNGALAYRAGDIGARKLQELLRADSKRQRAGRDSYTLVSERKSQSSKSWTYAELLQQTDVAGPVFPRMIYNE